MIALASVGFGRRGTGHLAGRIQSPLVRVLAALLGVAVVLPWYRSVARLDEDTYIGSPLPLIDWVVLVLAVLTIARPSLARALGFLGALDVAIAGWFAYVDFAEGLEVTILPGLVVATVGAIGLLFAKTEGNRTGPEPPDRPGRSDQRSGVAEPPF